MLGASDHRQHAGREQREGGEEVGVATIAAHVLGRVDLHQRGDEGDEQQRHDRQPVDVLADPELEPPDSPPRPLVDHRLHFLAVAGVDAVDPLVGGAGGDHQGGEHAGDAELAAAARQALAEQDDERRRRCPG